MEQEEAKVKKIFREPRRGEERLGERGGKEKMLHVIKGGKKREGKIEGLKGGEEYMERRRVCDVTEGEGGKGQNMKEEN